ncbi:MAG: hypothetical protein FWG33_02825 [Oscillospiraceae bacterium]|nr:hypothetical protein [Oscillospiraceae bacterium]
MNKHEFYKELLKEYTFDSAKVRRSAKRSSFKITNKHWWYIPSTVAVAAVSLTVGLFAFFYGGGTHSGSLPTPPEDRVLNANSAIKTASSDFGAKTMFLSFNNSITFHEMQNTLDLVSDTGNIVVETLYILDSNNELTLLQGSELKELETLYNSDVQIVGAKVYAPAILSEDLRHQKNVALVEFDMNDNDFIPLIIEDDIPVTDFPYTEEQTDEPQDNNFPASVEKSVSVNIPGLIEAEFIGDSRFIAVTRDSVILYEISEDLNVTPISELALRNYRKRFSITGKSMLISGVSGEKPILLLADIESENFESIDISKPVGSGELLNAFYDDINRRIIMKVRNRDSSAIYIVDRDTFEFILVPASSHDAVILALNGNLVYFSSDSSIYRFDISSGVSTELYTSADGLFSFERNADLSAFVMNVNGETAVFTARNEMFTKWVEAPNGLTFYRNSTDLLTDGVNFYRASEGTLETFQGQPISPERQIISEWFKVLEITSEGIKILIK